MAKFKKYSYEQQLLLPGCMGEQQYSATSPVCFERQILQGTFEYTLNLLINDKFKELMDSLEYYDFVGKYIAEYFANKGDDVYVMNRNNHPQPENTTLINCDRLNGDYGVNMLTSKFSNTANALNFYRLHLNSKQFYFLNFTL